MESGGRQGDVPSGLRELGPERDSGKRDYTQMHPQAFIALSLNQSLILL